MRKLGKWTLIAMAGAGVIVGFLIVIFIVDMTPDAGKEEEVKEKASAYLDAHFSGQMEMYDTLYDNMGNFNGFDYAAKVRNTTNGVDFTVYEDAASGEMVDTYAVNYFEDELSDLIMEDVEKRFIEIEMVMVSYADPAVTDKYIGKRICLLFKSWTQLLPCPYGSIESGNLRMSEASMSFWIF